MLAPLANAGSNYLVGNYVSPRYQKEASTALNAGTAALMGGNPAMGLINYGASLLPSAVQTTVQPMLQGYSLLSALGGSGIGAGVGIPLGFLAGFASSAYGSMANTRKLEHSIEQLNRELDQRLGKYLDQGVLYSALANPQLKDGRIARGTIPKQIYEARKKQLAGELQKLWESNPYASGNKTLQALRYSVEGPDSEFAKQMAQQKDARYKEWYNRFSGTDSFRKMKAEEKIKEEYGYMDNYQKQREMELYTLGGGRAAERRGMNPYAAPQPVQTPTTVPVAQPPAGQQFDPYKNAFVPTGTVPQLTAETARAAPGIVPTALMNNTPATSLTPQTQLTSVPTTAPVQPIAPTATIAPVRAYVPPMRPKATYQDYLNSLGGTNA